MKLTGNAILITGGSSSIGFALAKQFLEAKNKVFITGPNKEKPQKTKKDFSDIDQALKTK